MSKKVEKTLVLFKADKRINKIRFTRNKVGLRFIKEIDFTDTKAYINEVAENFRSMGYVVEVNDTYVTRTNMMSGKTFKERYDTPNYCSPSSESYWSM